jgi:hypothetical protein
MIPSYVSDFNFTSNFILGLKYKNAQASKVVMEAFELPALKTKWAQTIDTSYGLNDIKVVEDSVIVVSANGLQGIDKFTGEVLWNLEAKTGKDDYSGAAAVTALGIITGALTGTGFYSTASKFVSEINSNILQEDDFLYYASNEAAAKVHYRKGIQWAVTLDKNFTSKSYLYLEEGKIVRVNTGLARKGNKYVPIGAPYFAAHNSETGHELYQVPLYASKNNYVKETYLTTDTLVVLQNDILRCFDAEEGSLLSELNISESNYTFGSFVNDRQLIIADEEGNLLDIQEQYPYFTAVSTSDSNINLFDNELQEVNSISLREIYQVISVGAFYKVLYKAGRYYITSNGGKRAVELPEKGSYRILQDKLIISDGRKVVVRNLIGL